MRWSWVRLALVAPCVAACTSVTPRQPAAPPAAAPPPGPSAPAPAGPAAPAEGRAPIEPAQPELITLVVVGDVGLNRNQLPVDPEGVLEGRGTLTWAEMTANIEPLIDGDLNFMNFETVITDRNDLPRGNKRQKNPYLFRSHPAGVEHLARLGFNLVSAANNHAYDYGEDGVRETVRHLAAMANEGLLHFAGIGLDRASAARPAVFDHDGAQIAFGAIGIVTNMLDFHRAGDGKPGTLGYRTQEDWELATEKLAEPEADLRLLSVHYGYERDIRADDKQRHDYRWAIDERDVDVVIGHHAHVVRGIELHRGKLIFYGLGNFLIRGAANMGRKPELRVCCDYGLLAKVHLGRAEAGGYEPLAVQIVPIFDMHRIARRLEPEEAARRVEVVSALGEELDEPGAGSVGLRFAPRPDGSGLWCAEGASAGPASVAELCEGWRPPGPSSPEILQRVRSAPRHR